MLLFDEPTKYISSESKAANNKEDELKKIVDDAAKDLIRKPQSPKESQPVSTPIQG